MWHAADRVVGCNAGPNTASMPVTGLVAQHRDDVKRGSISRADFVAQNTAAWAAHGTITTISIVTPAQTTLTQAGFSTALATVDLTLTNGGTWSTVRATVSMIAEPDGWKYISIDPAQ